MLRVARRARSVHDIWQVAHTGCGISRVHRAVLGVAAGSLPAAEGPMVGARALEVVHATRGDPW